MSINRWINKEVVVHIHNGTLLSHKKECIWVSSSEVDEPRAYYTEWRKSEREKQILYINAHIRNLEGWHWWICLQSSNRDTEIENRLTDNSEGQGGREWDKWREQHECTCTNICKSVQFSCSVVSYTLRPHGLQFATRLSCPSPIPRACSNSCP